MFVLVVAASALFALVSAQTQLTHGYPSKVDIEAGASCVLKMQASAGATLLRVVVDVNDVGTFITGTNLQVFAGRYRNGGPSTTASGAIKKESNGDVILSLDRPTFLGAPEPWWLVISTNKKVTALVTAVAYDFAEHPRVPIQTGKRTGLIAVESGAAEIFYGSIKASAIKAGGSKIKINIDAANWGSIFDGYNIYVNVLNDAKIAMLKSSLSLGDLLQFLKDLSNAFKTGDFSQALPDLLTPTMAKHDIALKPSLLNFGNVQFDVPSGQGDTIFYIAIEVTKNNLVPFNGDLSAFSVEFSVDDQTINPNYAAGTCGALSRKRDVAQTSTCTDMPCADCAAATDCHYCRDATSESACRPMATPCGEAAAEAATSDACNECKLEKVDTACNAKSSCEYCSGVSADNILNACVDKWTCAQLKTSSAAPAPAPAAGPVGAPGPVAAPGPATGPGPAPAAPGPTTPAGTQLLSMAALALALLALLLA